MAQVILESLCTQTTTFQARVSESFFFFVSSNSEIVHLNRIGMKPVPLLSRLCILFICVCVVDVVSTLGVRAACLILTGAHCYWKALYELLAECVSLLWVRNMCTVTQGSLVCRPSVVERQGGESESKFSPKEAHGDKYAHYCEASVSCRAVRPLLFIYLYFGGGASGTDPEERSCLVFRFGKRSNSVLKSL